jgi:hypothetical protein
MFSGYYYCHFRISDGIETHYLESDGNVVVNCKNGSKYIIFVEDRKICGHKLIHNGKVKEHEHLGRFLKQARGKVILRYHPDTKRSLHGICERHDQVLFGDTGKCISRYSRGRFMAQEFRYSNRRLAFKMRHCDKEVTVKRPDGKIAAVISCPGGFSTRSTSEEYQSYQNIRHGCCLGKVYFKLDNSQKIDRESAARQFDYSKDGNCRFIFYDSRNRVKTSGEYRNNQRVGEWVINGRPCVFLDGIPVSKKLYETPAEKLKVDQVLKLKNAQLRAALLKKIGPERIAKEYRNTVIHEDKKRNMLLMEFPIAVDDGNGSNKSRLRILRVKCPTTKQFYYLGVPDFVWDCGKKTKLNKCEQARQWTFGVDDPRKAIKFEKET